VKESRSRGRKTPASLFKREKKIGRENYLFTPVLDPAVFKP
jgi:hypothetical protein